MALTFADTHNIITHLTKSDASEGFEQILDFLNASVINYALIINPTIYVSCIKQFWSSVSVKKVNGVARLQALIDRKKVLITEDTVREALHLDDAESIDCLPNEEIFAELARMGYENPSTKLTFYKAFFSAVGKGFSGVNTPLFKRMLVPQQAADDVDDVVADNVLADDVDDVIADVVAHAAAEPTPPSPTPTTTPPPPQQEVTSTPPPSPHQSPVSLPSSPPQQPQPSQTTTISMDLLNNLLKTCTTLTRRVKNLEQDKIAHTLEITKLKQRVKRLEKKNKLKISGGCIRTRGIIAKIDADKDVILEEVDAAKDAEDDELEPAKLKEVIEVVTTAKLMTEVVTAATTTITAAPSVARKRKEIVIRDPKETATPSTIVHSEPKSKDKGKYFNSNVAFLEKSKEQLEEEESRALKRKTKSSKEKAVKKQKLDEEVEELKKHLQIVPNDDDDVYIEATPLALKMISLVERRYPLIIFTLDQMLNNVRLEVEEESEVSLELLRFVRRQQQEGYRLE
nr:xylulose kinase-1 [Tanacetum cinerariifolium]